MKLNPNLDRNKILDCDRKGVLKLPSGALHLWLCLWMNENSTQQSYMSLKEIQRQTGMDRKTIVKWRRYLVQHGWLVQTGETAADMYSKATRGAHDVLVYRVDDPTKGNSGEIPLTEDGKIPAGGECLHPKNSTQDSGSVSASVSGSCSGSESRSLSSSPSSPDPAAALPQPTKIVASLPDTPQIEDRTERQDRGAAPHTPAGGTPAPPCGRMGVLGLDGKEYLHHWKDSKNRARTSLVIAKPEFLALTSETPCSHCQQPLGPFGSGKAAHEGCLDMSRSQSFWLKGKVNYDIIKQNINEPDPAPIRAAKPPLRDHRQEAIDHLTAAGQQAGKRHVQYFPDGAAYPDSWYRLSDEEKRLLIQQHARKKHAKISIS